jgi:hypothetical protein
MSTKEKSFDKPIGLSRDSEKGEEIKKECKYYL